MARITVLLVAFSLLCGWVSAQQLSTVWSQTYIASPLPYAASDFEVVGDLNGDLMPDIAIGVLPTNQPGGLIPNGVIELRSGSDGTLISGISAPIGTDSSFGMAIRVLDDVNGDGVRDLAVAAFRNSAVPNTVDVRVYIFDPVTGIGLASMAGPSALPGSNIVMNLVSDPDGDGVRSIAVGGNAFGGSTATNGVTVIDPTGGSAPVFIPEGLTPPQIGPGLRTASLIAVGDRNGDGVEDLVLGVSTGETNPSVASRLDLIDGANFSTIGSALAPMSSPAVQPYVLEPLNDLDGDGLPEFAIAGNTLTSVAVYEVGAVAPRSLTPIFGQFLGTPGPRALSTLGDVDGDGVGDWAAASLPAQVFRIFSGRNPVGDAVTLDPAPNGLAVRGAAPFRDLNGDGIDEFLISIGNEFRLVTWGGAFPYGGPQALAFDWIPDGIIGVTLGDLELTGAPASAAGLIGVSLAENFSTIAGEPLLISDAASDLVLTLPITFDTQGRFEAGLNLAQPNLVEAPLFVQALAVGPGGGIQVSNGLILDFLPRRISIASISPRGVLGGETVTIEGSGFAPGVVIEINGQIVPSTRVDDQTITFVAPNNPDFDGDLVVRNPTGDATFGTFNPTPVLNFGGPYTIGPAGGIAIFSGGPFTPGTVLTVGGLSITPTVQFQQQFLNFSVPAGPSGTSVTATLDIPGGPNSLGTSFPVTINYF